MADQKLPNYSRRPTPTDIRAEFAREDEQRIIRESREHSKRERIEKEKLLFSLIEANDYEGFLDVIDTVDLNYPDIIGNTIGDKLMEQAVHLGNVKFLEPLQERGFRLKNPGPDIETVVFADNANWIRENYDPEVSFEELEFAFFTLSEDAIQFIIRYYPQIIEQSDIVPQLEEKIVFYSKMLREMGKKPPRY